MTEHISETEKKELIERQDLTQENSRYSLRHKVLLVSFLSISLSLIISRSIPNTSALFYSNSNLQLSFKAADSFSIIEAKSIAENSQGFDEGNMSNDLLQSKAMTQVASVNTPQQAYYRVRKAWVDEKSQIGAFIKKENALQLAKENSGYKVYDSSGKEISLKDGL